MSLHTSRIPLIGDREMDDTPHNVPSDVGVLDRHSFGDISPAIGNRHEEDSPTTTSALPELSIESVTLQGGGTSREAVRCREKRQRRKERERLLLEEVELLTLFKAIVDNGPDLFSLHRVDINAVFSFVCEDFRRRLNMAPDSILGRPLASIVDPRDVEALRTIMFQVLSQPGARRGAMRAGEASGMMVHLRVVCGGLSCRASMTIRVGVEGIVVVTRLYGV